MNRFSATGQPPTVLFLCPSLAGAGVERRVCTLLTHIDPDRYRVCLGLLQREGVFLREVGDLPVHHVEPPLAWIGRRLAGRPRLATIFRFLAAVPQQRRLVSRVRPDIIVTFTLETAVPLALIQPWLRRRGIRWVISEDSNTTRATLYWLKTRWRAAPVIAILRVTYRLADAVTAVSTNVRQSLRTMYRVPEAKVHVIANPIDIERVRRDGNGVPPPGDRPYIVSAGRLGRVKRFDLLLQAFAQARRERPMRLVILGDGPEREPLERLARTLGVGADLILPGFVINPWLYMRHAEMFVLTSETEGFSNVLVEAMASGCPVISTDCGGPRDIIDHGRTGLIVDETPEAIARAILDLLGDRLRRERMVGAAAAEVAHYAPKRICNQFCRLLDTVRNTTPPKPPVGSAQRA